MNFARFYLSNLVPSARKIIWIDTDTIVQGDITQLWDTSLVTSEKGLAAVEDCSQKYYKYFNFVPGPREEYLMAKKINKTTCYFNAGVLVIDLSLWARNNVTEEVWKILNDHLSLRGKLFRQGVTQPPLLLIFYDNYERLDMSW